MKKLLTAALLAIAIHARAGDNVMTNYFAGYKYVAAALDTNTVTDIGLETNTAYVCFPLATLTGLTETQASSATGDVRAVIFTFLEAFYTARTASTNATATTIARNPVYELDGSNITERMTHVLRSTRTVGSATFE